MDVVEELRWALRMAVQEQLHAEPYDKSKLRALKISFSSMLEHTPSPDRGAVSDLQFRAIMAAELHAIFGKVEQDKST